MALPSKRPLWQNAAMLSAMIAFLVFSDWYNPGDKRVRLAGLMGLLVAAMSVAWLNKPDFMQWMANPWSFSKLARQISDGANSAEPSSWFSVKAKMGSWIALACTIE